MASAKTPKALARLQEELKGDYSPEKLATVDTKLIKNAFDCMAQQLKGTDDHTAYKACNRTEAREWLLRFAENPSSRGRKTAVHEVSLKTKERDSWEISLAHLPCTLYAPTPHK